MSTSALTVAQLNRYIKAMFDENRLLARILVKGELSNLTNHYASGHLYFSLKDAGACVKAVMFKSHAQGLLFTPQNGQTVLASASVSVYERDGVYQLYVTDMQPEGAGAEALRFQRLKEKLEREGLFAQEHKRPLPKLPLRIGVVTSKTGAALQDILNILGRRWPAATAVLAPVLVQGENAPREMSSALRVLNLKKACDVIILGRGGGSAEDLSAFNDEALAREIYASAIPVVSAVGHETDFTIADFVADLRAPTPSAAAELVSPDARDLLYHVASALGGMEDAVRARMAQYAVRLRAYEEHRALLSPRVALERDRRQVEAAAAALRAAMRQRLAAHTTRLGIRMRELDTLSPLQVLARGYAIAFREGTPVTDEGDVHVGDELTIRLAKGAIRARVTGRTEEETDEKGNDAGTGDGPPGRGGSAAGQRRSTAGGGASII